MLLSKMSIEQAKKNFSHLHLHTSYSLLDGAIRIPDLMKQVKKLGMSSVAMTDHGNMFGVVEFYKEAIKEGVKPIIGCEFYIAPGGRKEKRNIENLADGNNYHLILLAINEEGYKNIIHLTSRSYTEGFYRKPRIDYELLAEHSKGLVCLTACLGGEVQQKILKNRIPEAENLAAKLKEIFGKDRFYLEIQNHGLKEEEIVAKANYEIAKKLDIQLCLTNDSHFLNIDDHEAQDILLRISQKKTINDPLFFNFNPEFYVKSPEQMAKLYPELSNAFHNTMEISNMVDLEFKFGNPLLPRFDVPKGQSLDSYMYSLAQEGLKKRYPMMTPKVQERFEYEYKMIQKMDFCGYFLIVQDFINFAKNRKIPTGPGRGSAAGSIISYALGITDIDPLRYGLLFERFLNPDRKELPDIDVDFCTERRDEVIEYVRDKYGASKVGQIITYGTMAARACLKDVARVLDIPFAEANKLSQMFPNVLNISIEDALETSKELKEYSKKGDLQKKLFQVACSLEGNVRHTGVHAAGIVISPAPLEEFLPMATVAKDKERVIVTQYDMQALNDVGLVKMDFLGLRNLSVISETIESIEKRYHKKIYFDNNKMDNSKTYELIQSAELSGIFQLETSPGMRELVLRMKPESFEDLIALIALFRPGPLQSGMADSYIERKKGREKISYPHPALKEILESTYGVILYQEQVMQIAQKIGGFSPAQADNLRKAMGKKIHDKMNEMQKKFAEGAIQLGYQKKFANHLYEQMAQFASYGFNKSHSAAYACIVYQTAYLKANYPTDYLCALLNSTKDKIDRLVPYIRACHAMKIKILLPDVNLSQANFSVEKENCIRFGLSAVKNVGSLAIESVLEKRNKLENMSFHSFFHFMENIDLRTCNRRTIEALNFSGAFLSLGYKRKSIHEAIDMALAHASKIKKDSEDGQSSLFDEVEDYTEPIPRGPSTNEYLEDEIFAKEKEVLGFYFSGHPLDRYERKLRRICFPNINQLGTYKTGKKIELVALISDLKIHKTKKNKELCRLRLEDQTGNCEAVLFTKSFEKFRHKLNKEEAILIKATVEKKEDTQTSSLLIQEVESFNSELLRKRQEKSLHIKIIQNGIEPNILINQLKTLLTNNPGALQVFFHLWDKEKECVSQVIQIHEKFNVKYSSELCTALSHLPAVYTIDLTIGNQIVNKYQINPIHIAS